MQAWALWPEFSVPRHSQVSSSDPSVDAAGTQHLTTCRRNGLSAIYKKPSWVQSCYDRLVFASSLGKLSHINLPRQLSAKRRFWSEITQLSEEATSGRFCVPEQGVQGRWQERKVAKLPRQAETAPGTKAKYLVARGPQIHQ